MNKKILLSVLTAAILMISSVAVFAQSPQVEVVAGAAYSMTNAPDGNQVVVFDRFADGILTKVGTISTGGNGSGGGLDPLASQHSLILSQDKRWLLAVNAGSNEISVFRVLPDGLMLVDKVDSGGVLPVSLTIFHNLVYVLNTGAPANITGFSMSHRGELNLLATSTRSLGAGAFAQVGFDPEGEKLVVTDKTNNDILIYSVDREGLPGMSPVVSPSNGVTPFGFIFDRQGHLIVVETGTNAVSSYKIMPDNTLKVISPSVLNGQKASCWIAGNNSGDVFTGNPGTSSISAYGLKAGKGSLVLRDGVAGMGKSPIDIATAVNGQFLYALDPAGGTIDMFQIEEDGLLTNLGTVAGGFSIFAQGIAVR